MDAKELLTQVSNLLEKFGVKEALKSATVVDTIYNVMSQHGMKVDKGMFSIVMMAIANSDKIDLEALLKLGSGLMGANAGQNQSQDAAANPLAALAGALGGVQGQAAQQSQGAQANPLAALGMLAGALGAAGAAQGQQAQPSQNQAPNPADAINAIAGIANMLSQKK